MHPEVGTLHLVCGKIAAGKSTLTRKLASEPGTVLIREDEWLARLFPGEIASLPDYVRCSGRLRDAIGDHVMQLLKAGVSVVLDFPANTPATRGWMRGIWENAAAPHSLYVLDVSDEECKARLRRRNEEGAHEFQTSDEQFDAITKYFVPPSPDEGFNIIRVG
jgi:predicted kinase